MHIDANTGLLDGVDFVQSLHCSGRASQIDMLVIHNISLPPGQYGGNYIHDLFIGQLDIGAHPYFKQLEGLRVSSHLLIERSGKITQFVPFHQAAWHAGHSFFAGREACNDFSIGIELEGTDEEEYTLIQYEHLSQITIELMRNYPDIKRDRIVGHSDIAPGRKTDPGPAFDWHFYRCMLSNLCA